MINTVLFDLDGTLVDTAPDLAYALNQLRLKHKLPQLLLETITPTVSLGGVAMLELAFETKPGDENFELLKKEFLDIYHDNIAKHSQLFDGMEELLKYIELHNYHWGIVTNKSEWLTYPLLQLLELKERSGCIVCGDTAKAPKPDPAPMYYACDKLGVKPEQCVYIGDALRDIEAGRAAGMQTITALYGYIEVNSDPKTWQADYNIQTPLEVIDWLESKRNNG